MSGTPAEHLAEPYEGYEGTSMHVVENVPGLTYRRLDFYTRCGYITPIRPATGSGTQRLYDQADYPMLRRVILLLDTGIRPALAFPLARRETIWLAPGVAVSWATELIV